MGVVSLWRRLFSRSRPRLIADFGELAGECEVGGLIDVAGEIEAIDTIVDPIAGEECVAMEYRAWPQSTTAGIDGASPSHSRAFQLTCHHAADFVLRRAGKRILVRVDRGRDVASLHQELLGRYGLGLRSEIRRLHDGDQVRVIGPIERLGGAGSPLRADPYLAIVVAQRLWPLVED